MPESSTVSAATQERGSAVIPERSSAVSQERSLPPAPVDGSFVGRLGRLPADTCAFFERRPWLLFVLLMLVYLPAVELDSLRKPLWHDELFTYYLAQFPTLGETWASVKRLDLNPPLLYVLTRLSYAALGVSTLATRLPEIVFYMLALGGTFAFVKRRMGALFGGFAVTVLLFGRTLEYAYEARPYALLLGFLALALAAWQAAIDTAGVRRMGACALLLVAACGMILSHIFAIPALAVLIGAELWRERKARHLDLPVLAALVLPGGFAFFDLPILRGHGTAIYPASFVPTVETVTMFYVHSVDRELFLLLVSALAVLLFLGPAHVRRKQTVRRQAWFFSAAEWTALLLLALVPLALMLELMYTHGAFFPRYGMMITPAVIAAAAALFCRWTSAADGAPDQRAALIGMVVALIFSGQTFIGLEGLATGQIFRSAARSEPVPKPCQACAITSSPAAARDDSGNLLPLVDASGLTFVEMNHREPASTLSRVYYLTDREASTRIAHANIFEHMQEIVDSFHLRGHTEPYQRFIASHRHFYVLGLAGWKEDWVLPKLMEDGAVVRLVAKIKDSYIAKDLWEVTLPASPLPPASAGTKAP